MKQLTLFKKRKENPGTKWGRPVSTHTGARRIREAFSPRHPLHITLRLQAGLPNLRCKQGAKLVKHAIIGARQVGINIVHFAILSNHIHFILEAKDRDTFFRAMKSFCCRLSLSLRKWIGKSALLKLSTQSLFRGRYHIQALKTPRQVKHALQYVLLNPAKHFKREPYIDVYTSAALVKNWEPLIGRQLARSAVLANLAALLQRFLSPPSLWLLKAQGLSTIG